MNASPDQQPPEQLLLDLLDRPLTPDEAQQLRVWVASDPAARELYLSYMSLHSLLLWRAAPAADDPWSVPAPSKVVADGWLTTLPRMAGMLNRVPVFATIFAAAFLFMGLTFLAVMPLTQIVESKAVLSPPAESPAIARIEQADDCVWESAGAAPVSRDLKAGSRLELLAGSAEIQFVNGARVQLVGPARLCLESSSSGRLLTGQLAARVPRRALGFTIRTSAIDIIDLGTEFAVIVDEKRSTAVYVQRGKVQLHSTIDRSAAADRDVAAGDMVRVDAQGVYQPVATTTAQQLRAALAPQETLEETLQRDAGLVVYYGPSSATGQSTIQNLSRTGTSYDGVLVGGQWREQGDGFPPRALHFEGPREGVAFEVPEELAAVTLVARVRIEPAPAKDSVMALVMSQGWYSRGMVHWQLRQATQLSFCVYGVNEYNADLPSSQLVGRWVHLAVAYDPPRGRIAYYLDAQLVFEALGQKLPLVRLGPASVGALYEKGIGKTDAERPLTGDLAEFMLFRRALTAGEIDYLYRGGKPRTPADAGSSAPSPSPTHTPLDSSR